MLKHKKEYLDKLYSKLECMMENEKSISNDILDLMLDILSQQKRIVEELRGSSN